MAGSGGVGALTVFLGLDSTDYTEGLTKAQQQAKNFADSIKAIAIGEAFGEAIAEGAKQAFEALKELTVGALEAADQLNNLSKNAGVSITALGGIAFAASKTGGSLEDTAASIGKLNKSIAEAASDSTTKAAEAFKAIGVSVTTAAGQTKTADQVFAEVADKFATYADGPEKAAIALQLFGKAGAAQIALLDKGGQALQDDIAYYQRYSDVTQETADKASAFNETLININLINKSFGQIIISELLPGLQKLANAYLDVKEHSTLFQTASDGLRIVFETLVVIGSEVGFVFKEIGEAIGAVAAGAVALANRDFSGVKTIFKAYNDQAQEARKSLDEFQQSFIKPATPVDGGTNLFAGQTPAKPAAPKLPGKDARDNAAAILKAQLEGQIKLIDDFAKSQQSELDYANQLAAVEYSKGNESLQAYFDQQASIRKQALDVQLDAIAKDIAAEQAFVAKTTKPADAAASIQKIALYRQQASEITIKAANEDAVALAKNAVAAQQLADSYANLRATVLAGADNTFAAQTIKNTLAVEAFRKVVTEAGGDQSLVTVYAKQLKDLAALTDAQKQYNDFLTKQSTVEANIYADAALGGKSDLDTLAAVRDAREAAISQLQTMVDKYQALAAAGGAGSDAAQKFADTLTLSLKKAQAEIDPLAKAINNSLEDSFSNAFSGFLAGTKSAKDAFRDFANSVISNIDDIAAKNLAQSIFGTGSGGAGGGLSSLFSYLKYGTTQNTQGTPGTAPDVSNVVYTPNALGLDYVPYDGYKATLHQGERVQTAREAAAGNRAPIVNITNNTPGQVSTSTNADGSLQVVIDQAVKESTARQQADFASGTGPSAQAARARFGFGPGNLAKRG